MDGELLDTFPLLQDFISTKPWTALIIPHIEKALAKKGYDIFIIPQAVCGETEDIEAAQYYAEELEKSQDCHVET